MSDHESTDLASAAYLAAENDLPDAPPFMPSRAEAREEWRDLIVGAAHRDENWRPLTWDDLAGADAPGTIGIPCEGESDE